ncbi:MAG: hypothetical protein ABI380_11700, partial [Edaphobacter sp.]
MRCALAPHGSGRRHLLPGMRAAPGAVSGAASPSCGWTEAATGANFAMLDKRGWRCAMSAALVVLPMVWATARMQETVERKAIAPELAFYRKYTEALLRRYAHMSLELARVPSLLGKEMFRGKVTNYVVHGFD